MMQQMTFTYLACQTCQAKIHCETCGEEVKQSLLRMGGVDRVEINMTTKTLLVDGSDEVDNLEDKLEDLGLLIG